MDLKKEKSFMFYVVHIVIFLGLLFIFVFFEVLWLQNEHCTAGVAGLSSSAGVNSVDVIPDGCLGQQTK